MNLKALQKIHEPHYEKATNLLTRYLLDLLDQKPDQALNILEIGPGSISILLQSIVDCYSKMNTNSRTEDINISFIDLPAPEEYEEIRSKDGKLSFLPKTNEFEVKDNLNVTNLKAELIKKNFHEHLGEDLFDKFSAKEFDFIVMHSVLHELFIASKAAASKYFPRLFQHLHSLLRNDGILFFGDPYYPPYHGTVESHSFVEDLSKEVEHANAPVAFLHPEHLLTLLLNGKEPNPKTRFKLLTDEEMYISYKDKGRKFYLIVLQKPGETK